METCDQLNNQVIAQVFKYVITISFLCRGQGPAGVLAVIFVVSFSRVFIWRVGGGNSGGVLRFK